jgi:hypothetical protein
MMDTVKKNSQKNSQKNSSHGRLFAVIGIHFTAFLVAAFAIGSGSGQFGTAVAAARHPARKNSLKRVVSPWQSPAVELASVRELPQNLIAQQTVSELPECFVSALGEYPLRGPRTPSVH